MSSRARSYLDWNATAPVLPEVVEAVTRALSLGNPSSIHSEGRSARAALEAARIEVARLVNADAAQVLFTSGGTEAAVTALQPIADSESLIIGAGEHACVRAGGRFRADRIHLTPVDSQGRLDLAAYQAADVPEGPRHIAVQLANNETGVLNKVADIAALRNNGHAVTCDVVQAVGRIAVDFDTLASDFIFLSAHKIGGPKGVGALVFRKDACGGLRTLIPGGGQEKNARGGTENVAGIVGFGAAARFARENLRQMTEVRRLRDLFEDGLRALAADVVIFSAQAPRLPNTSLFAFPDLTAETALIALDLDGVALSSGSACSSGKVGKSHVLKAMGVSDALAACALRASFGWTSTENDIHQALESLQRQLKRRRRHSAA